MEKLMLSADVNVLLYEAKKTNTYNEQIFIEYIKETYRDASIIFIKHLGYFNEFNIPNGYKKIKWFNFLKEESSSYE